MAFCIKVLSANVQCSFNQPGKVSIQILSNLSAGLQIKLLITQSHEVDLKIAVFGQNVKSRQRFLIFYRVVFLAQFYCLNIDKFEFF